ncbi:DUF2953 domain-containing protein [Paenibacillus sp. 1011MAR3C5]|uniref:DUF2953 domain-containing protein n=1 Tax=Paenibacillus sp. 1011MAR3C5 TaxID=1675787 RepID=UPI000E6D0554|nr:DUF2953 domain-containing protein [Paenibacillus sp. 1011MAR3C5]RJE89997.1 DUF2953 domain-containing protein [Paenibacillus sp. 1011MAR3C5]
MPGYPYGWIWAGGFFLLAVIVVLSSPVVINGFVRRIGENDDAELSVKALFGLIRYRYKVPFMSMDGLAVNVDEQVSASGAGLNTWKEFNDKIDPDKVVSTIEKYKQILRLTKDLKGWIKDTLARVHLTEWRWTTSLGTGDAMWTAMATGAVWSVKTGILGLLSQMVHVKSGPVMEVHPNFSQPAFRTEWSCIAQIRFGYAILAGLQLLVRMKKWKGGVKAWQNILFRA